MVRVLDPNSQPIRPVKLVNFKPMKKTLILVLITAIIVGTGVYMWQQIPLKTFGRVLVELNSENEKLEHDLEVLKGEYECVQDESELFTWQDITFELPRCWTAEERSNENALHSMAQDDDTVLYLELENTDAIYMEMFLKADYIAPQDQGPAEIRIGSNYWYQFLASFDVHEFVLEKEPYQLSILTGNPDDLMVRDILGSIQLPKW